MFGVRIRPDRDRAPACSRAAGDVHWPRGLTRGRRNPLDRLAQSSEEGVEAAEHVALCERERRGAARLLGRRA
jgi:hypothetical protein